MKHFIFSLFLALFSFTFLFAQDNACSSSYMPFKKGTSFELSSYDKKGKLTAVSAQKVEMIEQTGDGFKATIQFESKDEKGKKVQEGTYAIICKDDHILMDLTNMVDPKMMEGFKDAELEINNEAIDIPSRPTQGQILKDGSLQMKAIINGMALFNMNMLISNRKVDALEKLSTPAGTFDCVKITQDTEIKMMVKRSFSSATWYAKGVGMVKTESYSKKGELESSTVLTKFNE